MSYWSAKSDLAFIRTFKTDVEELWSREDANKTWQHTDPRYLGPRPKLADDASYQEVRARISTALARATIIAARLRVPIAVTSPPPAAIGGLIIHTNMFEVILRDSTYRKIPRQEILDDLNRTVGACEDDVRVQKRHAWNPAWWLWIALVFVLRIPFLLLDAAGFDTNKFENELWAKLFKVVEVVLIAYFLTRWGLKGNGIGK